MSTKESKGKKAKDGEKRSAKKSEDCPSEPEIKAESTLNGTESTPFEDQPQEPPPKEPTPEPVYDEPSLSELIIESFEGEKVKGMYHGECEAFYTGGHVYKGQFVEGCMHGRGVYTWNDGMTYEGEFTQNQVTGKGVYRWTDGSTYDGDVLNGKRHGTGVFRAKNNRMSYSGEWCMGKRHGKGRMDYDSEGKSFYDGDWVNNVKHGWGMRQYASGNVYQGMWFNNCRHGEGTMKWMDKNQIYAGNWENGIQHGMGQHIWMLRRVPGSQYPLRNMYDGEFVNGLRHGFGVFFYASGAKYEGGWKNNMKHGKGKFTFKNGRIYEGMFERDHIVEYPDFTMDGTVTPDITMIRTRTPLPNDNISVHSNESRNTATPSFQLEIEHLLNEFTETDREEEGNQVVFVIMRHITHLRKIYNFYSCLGHDDSSDNTYIMNKMQFWRMLKDCKLHHLEKTLTEMDRWLSGHKKAIYQLHDPYEKILQREFFNNLIVIAYHLYNEEHEGTTPILAWCMSRLISDFFLRNACNVQGNFYYETRRATNALVHMDQAYEVYQSMCQPRKYTPNEPVLKMRQFLFMLKEFKLINNDLTPKAIIQVLSSDDPNVSDGEGCCNLELEMTFLEFFEALIGCAVVFSTEAVIKDPTTPRASTVITPEQSMYSMPVSPSRMTSQVDGGESQAPGTPHHGSGSPGSASPTRAVSSADVAAKQADPEPGKIQQSISNVTGVSENGGGGTSRQSVKDGQTLEPQKNGSFLSTNNTEDGLVLMPSSISLGGHTIGDQTEPDDETEYKTAGVVDITEPEDDEEDELDEATRQFNFWTHQIHIFFVKKFFPAAAKYTMLKQMAETKRINDARERVRAEEMENEA